MALRSPQKPSPNPHEEPVASALPGSSSACEPVHRNRDSDALSAYQFADRDGLVKAAREWQDSLGMRRLLESASRLDPAHVCTPPTPPVKTRMVCADRLPQPLTCCEMEILALMARGFTNPEIGTHCKIAPSTTRWHISNVLKKLGAKRRVEALQRASSLGLIHSYIS
jgi:DNA-binding CsgD family transcriptional regulator